MHYEILVEHLLLRERDAVDTGHLLALSIATPEGTCYACNLHCLDKASVHQVRTTAKVGEIALGICGDGAILQVLLNVLAFVGLTISLELSECISLSHLLANHSTHSGIHLHTCWLDEYLVVLEEATAGITS